jgi:hypothetical protein
MTTYTLAELFDKRKEIAGEIVLAEKQVRKWREDLAHIEAAIRILRPGIDLPKVVPRRVDFRPRHFKRGALRKLLLDYLRDHADQQLIAVGDMMPTIVGNRTLNAAEYQRTAISAYQALDRIRKRGIVVRIGEGVKGARWRLA